MQIGPELKNAMKQALTLSALALGAASCAEAQKPAERPNILFCIADDATFHHFSAVGCPWVNTPAFDRVAREGILFEKCYTPNAKSAPSRASVLTGRNSWQLKEAGNHICFFPAEFGVFPEALSRNGYRVAFTGKGWAPGDPGKINGQPRQLTGKGYQQHKTTPPTSEVSNCDYAANFAQFLDDAKEGPWMFWYGGWEPHRKYEFGTGERLGGKTKDMIDRVPAFWPDCDSVRTDMLDYAYELEYFDRQLGTMINELEKRGMLQNTLIVVTSDNGMPFPRSKANDYEYSNHMPCAMMWPGGIKKPGRRESGYISFIDYAPTFLEVAGVTAEQSGMQPITGRSLTDIFKDKQSKEAAASRKSALLGRERDDYGRPMNQGYPMRAIIRDNLLLILNLTPERWPAGNRETGWLDVDGSPTKSVILDLGRADVNDRFFQLSFGQRPAEELYDLGKDIDCVDNLADNATYAAQKSAMKSELLARLTAQQDPRIVGGGEAFDQYPIFLQDGWNFYERVVSGEVKEPWNQTSWVNPTDYDSYFTTGKSNLNR